jgi:hypothetical protein
VYVRVISPKEKKKKNQGKGYKTHKGNPLDTKDNECLMRRKKRRKGKKGG